MISKPLPLIFCILIWLSFTCSLFSNSISIEQKKIVLDPFYYMESEYSPGKYRDIISIPEDFIPYKGGNLLIATSFDRRMYTFITHFSIDKRLKGTELSLYIDPPKYAEKFYLNGRVIYKIGKNEKEYDSSESNSFNLYLPDDLLYFGNKKNYLAIELYPVENENHIFHVISLCIYEYGSLLVFVRNLISKHMVQAACVVSIFVGIYLIFLYFTRKYKDKKLLWFGLLCFSFTLSYINFSINYPALDLLFWDKVSRVCFPYPVLFLTFFTLEYTSILNKNRIIKLVLILVSLVFNILVIIQPTILNLVKVFNSMMLFLLAPQLIGSFIILVISIIKNKSRQSLYILGGLLAVISAAISDMYNASSGFSPYVWFVPYGFFSILLCIFFVLALEQAKTYAESINHAKSLDKKNLSLERLIRDIMNVSKNVYTSSKKLDESIQKAGNVTDDYRKSNSDIMEKIRSQFEYIENIINNITKRIDYSTEKIPIAIANQTAMVEQVTATISNINNHIISTMVFIEESNIVAQNLFKLAKKSSKVIEDTKGTIEKISEYSVFLQDVLGTLENITEKTNLLSINASIEAARSGSSGKGFSVVAGEIRNLSYKSKENLDSSFRKIKDMAELIESSSDFSENVSESLTTIIKESQHSAEMVNKISDLIKEQKNRSSEILNAVNSLLKDTLSIKEMTDEEKEENVKMKTVIEDLQGTLEGITQLLTQQETKQTGLTSALTEIKTIMEKSQEDMKLLNESVNHLGK